MGGVADAKPVDPLAGAWVVVSTRNGGSDDDQLEDDTATFTSGRVRFRNPQGKEHAAAYTIDLDKTPAAIDLVPDDGPHKGKTLKGIFTIERQDLKLCLGKEGEERPAAFRSKTGEATVLLVLRKTEHQDVLPPVRVLDHGGFFRPRSLGGRDLILLSLAFSPDGKMLASAGGGQLTGRDGGPKGEVKLWDVPTATALRTMSIENGIVFDARFSLDGKLLATASGSGSALPEVPGEVRLWNPATGELVYKLKGHAGGVYSLAFSPDGTMLASGSMPPMPVPHKEPAEIKLWDLKTGKELRTMRGHKGAVGSLAFTADSTTLASGAGRFDGRVKLWDVATGTDLGTLGSEAEIAGVMAFIPKTATLVVFSATPAEKAPVPYQMQVSLWDTKEKKEIESLHIRDWFPYRIARSYSGDLIAYTCSNRVKMYDVGKRVEVRSLEPSEFRMRPVAFSPDDELLAAGNDDGTVRIWSVAQLRK
jgi:uncharacterized protein (TIGR03067 family)